MSESSAPQSGKDLLKRIRPTKAKEKTQLCLRPDLVKKWQELSDELTERSEEQTSNPRLGTSATPTASMRKLATTIRALEAEIEDASVWFYMEATDKNTWQQICEANPPRPGNQIDAYVGYNRDAVLDAAIKVCTYDPVFEDCTAKGCDHSDCGTWQQIERSNPSEWTELRNTCTLVNQAVVSPPKSEQASLILDRRKSTSTSPAAGE